MRYKLFFIRRHSWSIGVEIAPNFYYTGNAATFDDIFKSKKTVFTLNGSPESDPKFKNLFPVYGYNKTYIVNIGANTFSFLLVGEESKLFNYDLIYSSSVIENMLSDNINTVNINKLYILQKEIGLDIEDMFTKSAAGKLKR